MDVFEDKLIGVEFGSCYGGGAELIGKLWGERGIVYGFDTFEGLPKQLAVDQTSFEATCMDEVYKKLGTEKLSLEYQNGELKRQNITNVKFVKGLISPMSCADIPYINYAFLDLDIALSMANAYQACSDKIVPKGYLMLHDVIPDGHIPNTHKWYENIVLNDSRFEIEEEKKSSFIVVLRRK